MSFSVLKQWAVKLANVWCDTGTLLTSTSLKYLCRVVLLTFSALPPLGTPVTLLAFLLDRKKTKLSVSSTVPLSCCSSLRSEAPHRDLSLVTSCETQSDFTFEPLLEAKATKDHRQPGLDHTSQSDKRNHIEETSVTEISLEIHPSIQSSPQRLTHIHRACHSPTQLSNIDIAI